MFDDAEERQATAPAAEPADDSDSEEGGSSSDGGESGSGGSDGGDAPPADLVEHIFDGSGKRSRPSSASGSKPGSQRGAGPAGGAGGMPRTPQPPPLAASEAERLRLERKRFMSSKAAVITSGGPGSQPGSQRRRRPGGTPGSALGGEEDGVSREEFMAMQREVQQLGEPACAVLCCSCGIWLSVMAAASAAAPGVRFPAMWLLRAAVSALPSLAPACLLETISGAAAPRVRGSSGPGGRPPAAPATVLGSLSLGYPGLPAARRRLTVNVYAGT